MSNILDEFFRLFLHIHRYTQEILNLSGKLHFLAISDTSTAGLKLK